MPQLLADRVPLAGYHVEPIDHYKCRVKIALASASGDVEVEYTVPQPDEESVFVIEDKRRVVVPMASQEELDVANWLARRTHLRRLYVPDRETGN